VLQDDLICITYKITMNRDGVLIFRLPSSTRDALRSAAEKEQRSTSNMALRIISEWLEANGHISATNDSKTKKTTPAKKRRVKAKG
jgi:hypothetical protein